mmetsp:Transcript_8075/g.17474  ORF Transcript_8075/g.17474 Transcript_8075/m.17474 type:complete len:85 (+) Transcript_8075:481-735(+)
MAASSLHNSNISKNNNNKTNTKTSSNTNNSDKNSQGKPTPRAKMHLNRAASDHSSVQRHSPCRSWSFSCAYLPRWTSSSSDSIG